MRGLSDKVVIITGGGDGIGTATCNRFAQEGAKVAVFDIDGNSAGRTAAQITETGGKAEAFACDITEHAACQRAVDAAEKAIGPADSLVNNAGWDVLILRRDFSIRLAEDHKHQFDRRTQYASRSPSRPDRATTWPYRQRLLGCGAGGIFRRIDLRGMQGGLNRIFEDHRA